MYNSNIQQGLTNRDKIRLLLARSAIWWSIKDISDRVNISRSSVGCHLNTLVRQKLVEEKIIYKFIGGRGRKVRHYRALRSQG